MEMRANIYSNKPATKNNGRNVVLVSIKPKYAELIKAGTKKWEYRKNDFDSDDLYFYETKPVGKVTIYAQTITLLIGTPKEIWSKTKDASGMTKKEFMEYFNGKKRVYAYKLENIRVAPKGWSLKRFGLTHAPQSYTYIERGY